MNKLEFALLLAYLGIGFVSGLLFEGWGYAKMQEQCQKSSDVDECVIIAIPKGKEGVYADK